MRTRKEREELNKEVNGEAFLKCKNCNGTGLKYWELENGYRGTNFEFCEVCNGVGLIDWLEPIMKGTKVIA